MKRIVLLLLCLTCVCALPPAADAAELTVMSPVAMRPLLTKVAADVERSAGHKFVFVWSESGKIKSDVESGVAFDIAILTPNLVSQGKLNAATRTPVTRSGIGVAVRKGAPKPDVSTTDAFKRAMMDAKSIGFVDQSATSRYVDALFAQLGIADAVKSKLRPLPGTAAQYLARGEVEIALTQISTIVPFAEIELAGPFPPEIQLYTVFTAAASPQSDQDAGMRCPKLWSRLRTSRCSTRRD